MVRRVYTGEQEHHRDKRDSMPTKENREHLLRSANTYARTAEGVDSTRACTPFLTYRGNAFRAASTSISP